MSFQLGYRWLVVVSCGVMLYSAALILLPESMQQLFRTLFFPILDSGLPFTAEAAAFTTLVQGVLGAVLIGWMTTILMILTTSFRQRQRVAWNALALSIAIWFVVDTGFSLVVGVPAHALFNLIFVVLFAVPLIALYPHFQHKTGSSWQ